jgi:hypothetical protein
MHDLSHRATVQPISSQPWPISVSTGILKELFDTDREPPVR